MSGAGTNNTGDPEGIRELVVQNWIRDEHGDGGQFYSFLLGKELRRWRGREGKTVQKIGETLEK
ncbi:hypothetical protein H6P81_003849 [Aristolochia fimbriata]|uniref:Uncharacterized protein n=1 Tax=Aristolochia fimbriata TaxID=158543 RepID=A0AAV7FGR3_ARIFI|nr:hypothetical protein H6P81_003849 [Aristolochia fimbriata]